MMLYADEVLQRFGTLKIVEPTLIPVEDTLIPIRTVA